MGMRILLNIFWLDCIIFVLIILKILSSGRWDNSTSAKYESGPRLKLSDFTASIIASTATYWFGNKVEIDSRIDADTITYGAIDSEIDIDSIIDSGAIDQFNELIDPADIDINP